MRRFFAPPGSIDGNRVTLRGREAHHIAVVLRARPGDRVVVLDGSGIERAVDLSTVSPDAVHGQVVATRPGVVLPVDLLLVQGVPKGAKMDDVIRMGTELGVREFLPVHSSRAIAKGGGRVARWRRIAVAAAKQSGRGDVPLIETPRPLPDALQRLGQVDLILLLWERERATTIGQALRRARGPRQVAVVVGPEGGFEAGEVSRMIDRGAVPITLGPLVLRTETAGVVALAMVLYELILRG